MGRIDVSAANGIREPRLEGRYMVARGGAAQQRNPGKDEKYFGTPLGVA